MKDKELAAMESAYQALRGMEPTQWARALSYLADRLSGDDRTVFVHADIARPAPTQFIDGNDWDLRYESADELVTDNANSWEATEVCGLAVVSQRFAVLVPVGDGEDVVGHEVSWFDTREAAESYIADALSGGDNANA